MRFALALVADPAVLILDEPTVGVDVEARRGFWASVRGFAKRGKTVIFATHYPEEADAYADRVILTSHGRVVANGPTSEVRAQVGRLFSCLPRLARGRSHIANGHARLERRGLVCHSRGCCLVLGGVDDPSIKEPVMRVFVAGATGAIGKQLVPRLVAAGHEVHGMTRSESKQAMLDELGAVPVVADALSPDRVAEAVGRARPELIVHQLTAIPATLDLRHFDRDFALTNRLRTEGTDYLLSAGQAVGVRRFVAQSYGAWPYVRTGGPVKSEEDPLDPTPAREMREGLAAIRHLEQVVLGARWTEGIVLRYGGFYGPGTSLAPGSEQVELVRKRKFPLVGDGGGVWSFIHIADAAEATVAAVERGSRGVYNVVDDDPGPVAEWLPALAQTLGAKKPMRVPRFVGRLFAGEAGVVMMTEIRGASNAKAKRELGWRPAHPSWRQGFAELSGARAPERPEFAAAA